MKKHQHDGTRRAAKVARRAARRRAGKSQARTSTACRHGAVTDPLLVAAAMERQLARTFGPPLAVARRERVELPRPARVARVPRWVPPPEYPSMAERRAENKARQRLKAAEARVQTRDGKWSRFMARLMGLVG